MSSDLYIYRGDFGLDIFFNLKSRPFRFSANTVNLLMDYEGAYVDTTLVNPLGEESTVKNIAVVEGEKLKMTITKEMTNSIDLVGIYQIQFHIGNSEGDDDTSMFSIPPIKFEVKNRLSGWESLGEQ